MKSKARIVLTTAGSQEEAQKIAHALVDRKLAACVNIVPRIESVYRWQGKVESAAEWLLLVKTTDQALPSVRDAIKELHSYELPECVMLEVADGSEAYLGWIGENVEPQRETFFTLECGRRFLPPALWVGVYFLSNCRAC